MLPSTTPVSLGLLLLVLLRLAPRAAVLTYRRDSLPANVTVAGPIAVRLQISSSGTDSDFIVKLIDEDAAGHQQLVRGEPMRAKLRNSFSMPAGAFPRGAGLNGFFV